VLICAFPTKIVELRQFLSMRNFFILLLLGLFASLTHAQEFKVVGELFDSESKEELEAATVYLETLRDSTLVTYTITNSKGAFSLEGKTTGSTCSYA
jgi:hypothetical protein